MKWNILAAVCLLGFALILTKWILDSKEFGRVLMFSREQKEIVVKEKDELFGTEIIKSEWKKGFWLGLLPPTDKISPSIILGVVPLSLISLGLSGGFYFIGYKNKKKLSLQK